MKKFIIYPTLCLVMSLYFKSEAASIYRIQHYKTKLLTDEMRFKKYIGDYNLNGANVKLYLTNSGSLKTIISGQPELELVYIKDDEFTIKGAIGVRLLFSKDNKNNITGFTLVQPNSKFTAVKK